MKKLTISIAGKNFEIKLERDFAFFLENFLEKEGLFISSDLKNFLNAFLKLAYENFSLRKEIEEIEKKLDEEGI